MINTLLTSYLAPFRSYRSLLFKFSTLRVFALPFVGLGATYDAVASAGWVTPGAATEGVTPLFFPENLATFFAHRCHYHYRFLLLSLGCHPLQGVTPHLFYLSDLVSPLFFLNLPTNFFPSGVTPGGCHPGRPPS